MSLPLLAPALPVISPQPDGLVSGTCLGAYEVRFEREAKTLAALNLPHIAQICGLTGGICASG